MAFAGFPARWRRGCFCWSWRIPPTSLAHETDNFYLSLHVELADIGDYLEAVHTLALEETVAEVNAEIERALKCKNPEVRRQTPGPVA